MGFQGVPGEMSNQSKCNERFVIRQNNRGQEKRQAIMINVLRIKRRLYNN